MLPAVKRTRAFGRPTLWNTASRSGEDPPDNRRSEGQLIRACVVARGSGGRLGPMTGANAAPPMRGVPSRASIADQSVLPPSRPDACAVTTLAIGWQPLVHSALGITRSGGAREAPPSRMVRAL